jgi:hypothetical protein
MAGFFFFKNEKATNFAVGQNLYLASGLMVAINEPLDILYEGRS